VATVAKVKDETATARTLTLDVPGWPGHLAGQHVAVKLTAADGYSTQRDYSIANPGLAGTGLAGTGLAGTGTAGTGLAGTGTAGTRDAGGLEITVQRLAGGEVSPYLAGIAEPGDQFEVRGPIGGWFAWPPDDPRPLLLLAGGSGIVPLMSMIRTHAQVKSKVPVRLIYSARTPDDVIYADELIERVRVSPLTVTYAYTRWWPGDPPAGARVGRIDAGVVDQAGFPPEWNPLVFICGPSGFVEAASALLIAAGHPPFAIKTERFGSGS
jgi:ferredoxin-NADP reductase